LEYGCDHPLAAIFAASLPVPEVSGPQLSLSRGLFDRMVAIVQIRV